MGSKQVVNRTNDIGPLPELDAILCTPSKWIKEVISDIDMVSKNIFDCYLLL